MDKWNMVQTAQLYMQLLYDNWDRLTDGGEFDKGVAKVAGKRTEGLVAGNGAVVVYLMRVEWEYVCRIVLEEGRTVEASASVHSEEALQDVISNALWLLVEELRKEDAQ